MFLLWILLLAFNSKKFLSAQDVQLSIENTTKMEYVGYLWANSKFVFLTPFLRATAIKGKSTSEKICGFELTSSQLKRVPFMVYLVDELSGLGEMQVKPHIDLDHQKETVTVLTVEAYDCDSLPHYSNRVNVVIYISNSFGPNFNKKAYSFFIRKDSQVGTVVGHVGATGNKKGKIKYSLYHVGNLPFELDESGTIRTLSSLESVNNSLIYFRVVATEESKSIPTQSITSVTIEIQPVCTSNLNGIPDQLDYKVKSGSTSMMKSERLIQDQHQPRLIICDLPSLFKQITLSISLIHFPESPLSSDNDKTCYTDIASSRLQRRVCGVHPGTIDLFLTHGGIMNINKETKSVGPDVLPVLNDEFTLTWWMKRESNKRTTVFCFQNEGLEEMVSLSIVDCKIIVSISGAEHLFIIPANSCLLDTWLFYTISQYWRTKTTIRVTVADEVLPPVNIKENILQQSPIRFFVGQCSSSVGNILGQFSQKNQLQIGVVSLSKEKSLSSQTVGCMSTCGEAVLVSDSIKKLSAISFERRGSSLYFTSSSIPEMIKIPSIVEYANSYYWSAGRHASDKVTTHVAIDLSVDCKNGETVKVPRTLIKVNIVLPQRDPANDTNEVDIYTSTTVLVNRSQSVRLFPDLRFVNSMTEEPVKRNLRFDGCSIRPLQRSFVIHEKIYLARLMVPILMESKLTIKHDSGSWNLEGDGTSELYESLLRHVTFDMVNERRKLFIICTLKGGELTSQAFVDVILPKKNKITIINEEHPTDLDQYSSNDQKRINEPNDQYLKDHFDITKSKFIAIVIMAVVGGATWAVVTVAITCFIIRRRGNLIARNRMKLHDIKSYQREISPTFQSRLQSSIKPLSGCTDYEYDEDRISMADIPDADEHCLDNISCDTCNMTDHDNSCNNTSTNKDIPRSKTINFPIIHKRF